MDEFPNKWHKTVKTVKKHGKKSVILVKKTSQNDRKW